jgi:mRNA interferase YafQ
MRTIERSSQFKKDLKRELKGQRAKQMTAALENVVELLQRDQPLPKKFKDHQLTGNLADCRDCHVLPNLVLLYEQPDDANTLRLVRLGSHAELFKR